MRFGENVTHGLLIALEKCCLGPLPFISELQLHMNFVNVYF